MPTGGGRRLPLTRGLPRKESKFENKKRNHRGSTSGEKEGRNMLGLLNRVATARRKRDSHEEKE